MKLNYASATERGIHATGTHARSRALGWEPRRAIFCGLKAAHRLPHLAWFAVLLAACLQNTEHCFLNTVHAAAPKRPNILLIYADDQSYKTVGCYPESFPWVKTPNIDRLAAAGVRFHAAYLGAWCMPSRAAMLTGRHPHGVESMRMEGKYPASAYDPKQCPFWPAVFRQSGYHTAHIGKWHTGVDAGWGRD